ncbi:helix-turn-helix domain-containing protein [Natronobiforma cellulositropha]|uniref:helix-turn-helix domain-containing protein n=1 Tax=Natronobiforma cellulositropha TaxID=1679076 RepID=UPI0021D5BC86|nr:helix-turn-helix domain-containing protein [Natronobiforma cellulositropha]
MTTVAEVTLPIGDVALAGTFEALPDLEVRVKSVVADGPLQTMPLVWMCGATREELDAALASDHSVDRATCLLEDPEAGEWLYRLEYTESVGERCRCIYDHDGTILDAGCSSDRWTFRLLFPDRDLLSGTVEALESAGARVDVRRLVEAGRDGDLTETAMLTEPQEEAISEAYRRGYYDVPRGVSLEELADELDISHQALSERLRRANKVLAGERVTETATG